MNKILTLDEFVQEQMSQLAKFKEYWLKGYNQNPESFPLDMKVGDWDEQFDFVQDMGFIPLKLKDRS